MNHTDLGEIKNSAVVKTVSTSEHDAEITRKKGLTVFSTLTGFKFIVEKIMQFKQVRIEGNENRNYTFILSCEES